MQAALAFFSATPSMSLPPSASPCVKARHSTTEDASTLAGAASSTSKDFPSVKWAQKTVVVPAQRRGCHLITSKIVREIGQDLSGFKCGLAHFFLQHTSASLTINENYDSDVRHDTETFLSKVVPEGVSAPWKHTLEGPDDMPAHIKSSMFGCTLTIPITNGQLNMELGREFGCASTVTMPPLDILLLLLMVCKNGTNLEQHDDSTALP